MNYLNTVLIRQRTIGLLLGMLAFANYPGADSGSRGQCASRSRLATIELTTLAPPWNK